MLVVLLKMEVAPVNNIPGFKQWRDQSNVLRCNKTRNTDKPYKGCMIFINQKDKAPIISYMQGTAKQVAQMMTTPFGF